MSRQLWRMPRPDSENFPEDAIGWVNSFDDALWQIYTTLCYAQRELDGLKSTSLAHRQLHPSFARDLVGLEASAEGMETTIVATYEKWAKAIKEEGKRASRQRT